MILLKKILGSENINLIKIENLNIDPLEVFYVCICLITFDEHIEALDPLNLV
jgi:hypothetical protein